MKNLSGYDYYLLSMLGVAVIAFLVGIAILADGSPEFGGFLLAMLILAALCGIAYSAYRTIYDKIAKKVADTSPLYQYLMTVPNLIDYSTLDAIYPFTVKMKSKAQLDRLNLEKQMMTLVSDNESFLQSIVKQGAHNETMQMEYEALLEKAPSLQLRKEAGYFYARVEEKVTKELEEKLRPVVPKISVTFSYTSPQGRNYYHQDYDFTIDDINGYFALIQQAVKQKTAAQIERSRMTDSMRYDVLKRDGFKCVICGRGAQDGVKLHVDHIKPIAKGGKTEMSNLQTLCETCNWGKSDKYDGD